MTTLQNAARMAAEEIALATGHEFESVLSFLNYHLAPIEAELPRWDKIENAPKWKDVLVWRHDSGPFIAKIATPDMVIPEQELEKMEFPEDFEEWYSEAYGWQEGRDKPTHFMPIPKGPEA